MKVKIIVLVMVSALATTKALAQAVGTQFGLPNLSGVYRCVHNCAGAQLGRIVMHGWELTVTNEIGQTSKAWIDRPGHIWVSALNEAAVYSPDAFTIQFHHGSVWVLVNPEPFAGFGGY
jgi:hypothetical protein